MLLRQITISDVKNYHYKNIATRSVSNYPLWTSSRAASMRYYKLSFKTPKSPSKRRNLKSSDIKVA